MEHILASCAVPNIFPAVPIGDDVYWDGLFSDNPPVSELVRAPSVGDENLPEEIWLIKINPTTCDAAPVRPDEILDRCKSVPPCYPYVTCLPAPSPRGCQLIP
jgi:NTE family protein